MDDYGWHPRTRSATVCAGGWADFVVWRGGSDNVEQAYEKLESADDLEPLLDRHLSRLLS